MNLTAKLGGTPAVQQIDNVASWSYIEFMKAVGLRELKNRLSEYVRQVRAGETVLVTDRGEVVAELCPPGQANARSDLPPGLLDLARKGLVTLGGRNHPSLYRKMPPVRLRRTSAELLDEERGER